MSGKYLNNTDTESLILARSIYKFAVSIALFWLAVCAIIAAFVPSLESVGENRSVSLTPRDAPAMQAIHRIGAVFKESDSDSIVTIVLEGDQPLGTEAHKYYDDLVRRLRGDTRHVQHVQDFWGDPLTASGSQSADDKAAYVQLNLAGNQGEPLGNESVEAVRSIVDGAKPPPGIAVYVTGTAALVADMQHSGDRSLARITVTTAAVIFIMLLLVYRSPLTVVLLLLTVGAEFTVARGVVALLGQVGAIALSTFAVSLLTSLAIAAGTDYGIFIIGRYQEARQAGEDRETAFYTMYRGVAHVIAGSGLTIAGATSCLSLARLPYFRTLGIPCAVGMLLAVVVALTLGPAVLAIGSRFGVFDPKRMIKIRGWRRIGTVVVRWPGPVLAATIAIALIGLLALPAYTTSYNNRDYTPGFTPANQGFAAADRHFSQSRMKPEALLIESDHDLRNPADFLVLDKVAKEIFRIPEISRVQGITRPEGKPMDHTSIPFQISMQNASQMQNLNYQRDRMDDLLRQADAIGKSITVMKRMYDLMMQMSDTMHQTVIDTGQIKDVTDELRDHIADFDDFWRPIRSYFYCDKHCNGVPMCWSLRSIFDALDGVDKISDELTDLLGDVKTMDRLMPLTAAQIPPQIEALETVRDIVLTMHSTMIGIYDQMDELSANSTAMGKAFDTANNDDSFYLPPEVFTNANFKRIMKLFLSPDGHAARFIILHRGDPDRPEGIACIDLIRTAAEESLKGSPLEDSRIYLTGTGAVSKDLSEGAKWDLLIAGIASLCLISIIMLILTRALIAATVIVGTVALSLGASFGLSVLVWQHIFGIKLHWLVLPMSVIVLLAVGSDYNLLLVSRFKQEIGAGLNTGIIRAIGGTGKVVTNAGLVFAITMASTIVSDLRIIGQVGTTISLGLLFDTLIVRAFMTPSIAALLGRWFWWPLQVRTRPTRPTAVKPRRPDPPDHLPSVGERHQTRRLRALSTETLSPG
ncbi:MMPL family RND transporter [Mycobacterium liflandii]|nr:MMPL family RND transporter [Mycobacterium liflandii]